MKASMDAFIVDVLTDHPRSQVNKDSYYNFLLTSVHILALGSRSLRVTPRDCNKPVS